MFNIDSQTIELLMIAIIVAMLLLILYLAKELRSKNEHITKLIASHSPVDVRSEMFNFYDEKGELKLSVKPEVVYYIESADNYVVIHYLSGNKFEKMFLRNTLKNLEWRFKERSLVRCHRSYIVNLSQVQMLRSEEGEVMLDFGDERIQSVPVSKGYIENITNLFTSQNIK